MDQLATPPATSPHVSSGSMVDDARKWLTVASLSATGLNLVFFILAPSVGYPLDYPENWRLMAIVLPVVLGYLGSMTAFIVGTGQGAATISEHARPIFMIMVKGPVLIFAVATFSALFAFGYSNRAAAPAGTGMTVDQLSAAMTASLGLLTATTTAITAYLFGKNK